MATASPVRDRYHADLGDLTGAVGDAVTVLPLVAAVGLLTPASLPHVLAGFAVFQLVWGVVYGVPLSVEPMKALAGLAVAGAIAYGDLVAAGVLAGGVLLVAGRAGLLSGVAALLGEPVIRGVQFAVAALLVVAGADLVVADPAVALVGLAIAALVAVRSARAVALAILAVGLLWAIAAGGLPAPSVPGLTVFPTGGPTLSVAVLEGTAAQLAMTVGNAAVATSLLLSDLYDADVSPDRLAESMGVMNLAAVPLGALPMCHGSGGLAGKHAFGARTAGANLVLAALYGGAALVAGLWSGFPMAALGVLLVIVAVHLGRVALESVATPAEGAVVVGTGVVALAANVGVAFLLAAVCHAVYERLRSESAGQG